VCTFTHYLGTADSGLHLQTSAQTATWDRFFFFLIYKAAILVQVLLNLHNAK